MIVAMEQPLVTSEPFLDDGRVAFHSRASVPIVFKALQKIAYIGKQKWHGLCSHAENLLMMFA